MEHKPRIPRVIFHGKNNNRENSSSNEECQTSSSPELLVARTEQGSNIPTNESHSYNSLSSSEFSSSALGSSHSTLNSGLDLSGEVTSSSYNALNQTYTSEIFFEVHKVQHHDFEKDDPPASLDFEEGASQNGYTASNSKVGGGGRGQGRGAYDGGTDYCESEESGCETETTLRASTERDTSEESSSKTEVDVPRERSLFEEEYTNFGLTGWRGVELFIREEGDEEEEPLPPPLPRFGHFRSTARLGLSVESVESAEGGSEGETGPVTTEADEIDCGKSNCEMELAETDLDETDARTVDIGETDLCETDVGETDIGETDIGLTDIGETDIGETDIGETDIGDDACLGETDIGETDFFETDIGETDLGETDIGETDLGETDIGETDFGETDAGETTAAADRTEDVGETDLDEKDAEQKEQTDEQLDNNNKNKQDMQQGSVEKTHAGELEVERPTRERPQKPRRMTREARGRAREEREQRLREKREREQSKSFSSSSRSRDTSVSNTERDFSRSSSMEGRVEGSSKDVSIKKELSMMRSRLVNLRKVIHAKNEEIRELKLRMKIEKSSSNTQLSSPQKDRQKPGLEVVSTSELAHLRRELSALRQEKERLRAELAAKTSSEREKAAELRRFKQQHERQMRTSKSEARREEVRESRESLVLQKTLAVREKELKERQKTIHKLECEKMYLGEEIYRITGVEEGFWSDQTLTRPTLTDKERCLVRRNSSLNTQLSRLQIHVKSLSSENDNLKNKMELEMERPLELREKDRQRQREVQVLKRKNSELASITRKLEEKVKNLEKKTKESPATERRNLILARQREKEALYENQLRERDKEIQRLKVRMKELVRKLTGKNGEITRAQSTLELEQIIRTVTKERLQLERHLAAASEGLCRGGGSGEGEAQRLAALEDTNATLRQQLEDLEILTRQHHTLRRHVQEKDLECVTLKEKLKLKNELCQDLECQLARVIEKNTELTIQNSDLQKQIQELQHVSEECKTLKHTLNQVESDWSTAKVQVGSLQGKVGNLESVLRLEDVYGLADGPRPRGGSSLETVLIQMKEAADKRRELERQHAEALAQLREQQAAIADSSKTNQKDRKASVEVTEALQSKIRELEKKAEVQNLRHEELLLEMQSLKKAQGSPKNSWSRSGSLSADLQSPDSGDVTPDSSQILSNGSTARSTPVPAPGIGMSLPHGLDAIGLVDLPDYLLAHHQQPPLSTSPLAGQAGLTSLNSLSSGIYTNTTSSSLVAPGSVGLTTGSSSLPVSGTVENASSEIDRIMAKIEQDNKILAELDKSRSTIDKNLVNGNIPGVMMPPFETDNRILDVLEIPGKGRCHVYIARYSYDPFQHSPNENPEAELAVNAGDYVLVWGAMDEDGFFDGELLDGRRGLVPSNFVEKLVGEDLIEFHQSVVMGLRDGDESMSTSVPQDLDFISQDESQIMIDLGVNQTRHNAYSSYIDLEDIIEEEEETLGEHDLFFSVLVPPPVQLTLERQLNKSILIGWNPPPEAPPDSIESYHVYVNGLLKTTVRATERTRALVEGVDSTKLHRISVRSVTPNRRTSRDAACTMVIGKDSPLGPTSVKATSITSTSAVISWLPSNSNFQHTVCVNNVEVRTVKPGVYRHTITGLSPNTTYRVTIRAKNLRAPQFDEKASKNQDRLSTTIEFRTLPKGLPDPPVDVQVEPGPQDGSLLVTWLPVTINSTGGTSNGAPVTGYAVYADGKKVTEVESPTGDHALIDLTKIPGFEPKQVTVRTKSRDSVSADSVPSQIPNHFTRGRGRGKDMHADGHKPGPHHGLPGPHGPQGVHHTSGPAGLRDRLLGRRGAPPPGTMTDHLGQTILDHEDNLSDKEIYPGQQPGQQGPNAPIPAIGKGVTRARQITKDSASDGLTSAEVFSEEDYEHGPGGRGRFDPRAPAPRSHMERGRPPPPPHHNRAMGRDPRDMRDGRDPRDPHYRDGRDPRDLPRDRRDPHMREPHNQRDPRDPRDMRDRYDPDGRHRDYGRDYPVGREGRGRGGGGVGGPMDQHTRIFVALFDYDPSTMSPNPEACEEELPFREGQLIKVYGDKDPDGFYWGEAGGLRGYVPCNMVSEVQVDDDRVAQELLKESDTGRRRRDGSVGRRGHQADRWGDIYANMPVRKMIAMYDYDPQELSPNVDSEVELSFQTGDIIYVYGDMDDDGFYMGELRNQRGLVPSNFLQDAPQDYSDDHRSRRDTLDPRDRGPPGQTGRGTGPGAHGPPPPPRPDQRDRRKGYEGGPGGPPPRPRQHQRGGERW